jgi:hypothetical protein
LPTFWLTPHEGLLPSIELSHQIELIPTATSATIAFTTDLVNILSNYKEKAYS